MFRSTAKVLHVTGLAHGGSGRHVLALATQCETSRYELTVAFARTSPLADDFRRHGVRVVELALDHYGHPLRNAAALAQLVHLISRERFDIVHTHTSVAGVLGRMAAKAVGGPTTVHMLHGFASHARAPWLRRHVGLWLERGLDHLTDVYVAGSQAMIDQGMRRQIFGPDRAVLIPNGVDLVDLERQALAGTTDLRASIGLKRSSVLVGFLGRLEEAKGCEYLIRAAAAVIGRNPRVHFMIAGDGALRKPLEKLSAQLGVTAHVHFLGWRADGPALIRQFDLLAMPSRWESFGLAAAEAMALRRPVVAARVDGLAEVIDNQRTGLLIRPEDPIALAEAVLELAGNPARRASMGEEGRRRVERNFTLARMVAAHEALYERLLGQEAADEGRQAA